MSHKATLSVVVLIGDPARDALSIRMALERQVRIPDEVIVVDSSADGSVSDWLGNGYRVHSIAKADFHHGRTRNLGASLAQGEILVFMTQDALLADEYSLENLVFPIESDVVEATYARQVPKEDAGLLERFARGFNYPARPRTKSLADVEKLGFRAFFFSDVCSAVRANVFWEVGGFPENTIMMEDALLCAKLLRAGYKVKYEAEAQVFHSHNWGMLQQFKRNFDVGVSISQAGSLLKGARVTGEGFRFVTGQAWYVYKAGDYIGVLRVFAESAARYLGFSLGKRERYIPRAIKRHLSLYSFFWS
ncbi:MAG: glycosyltransferase [Pyrinomonadaceae bacterium]|nr:glycosyltransferase [Pyrinomonadaceae bacterium]